MDHMYTQKLNILHVLLHDHQIVIKLSTIVSPKRSLNSHELKPKFMLLGYQVYTVYSILTG
jgi:hypothetical protein